MDVRGSYSAIQFRTDVEPLKETTICLSTGSTPTMPLVSATRPLFTRVRCCQGCIHGVSWGLT